jgi:hypothetical protein
MNSAALWQTIFAEAVRLKHPEPEKMADSCIRARERSIGLKLNRRSTKLISKLPTGTNKAHAHAIIRKCCAITLGNRQCTASATQGGFCAKHFVKPL